MEGGASAGATGCPAVLRSPGAMRAFRAGLGAGARVAFVPTMGGLHDGHLALVRAARAHDVVVASVFVNPAQFAPDEDLATYPADEAADLAMLGALGVDAVYAPRARDVYPPGFCTYVSAPVGRAGRNPDSEGASRPIFFRGVATVILACIETIRPHFLYAGQKDAQQCAVIRAVAGDLWTGVQVVVIPTVREHDGLAMSTRNQYLSAEERRAGPVLFQALLRAQRMFRSGVRDADAIREGVRRFLEGEWVCPEGVEFGLKYVSVCDGATMEEMPRGVPVGRDTLVCIAGMMGRARLIDNCRLGDALQVGISERPDGDHARSTGDTR